MRRADFCDSDSFFENETQAKLEQSRTAFSDDAAEVFGTALIAGRRSLDFRASLKRLAKF
ncbi:hypothetical protein IVA88_21705 [Bradyrhizobium sp. 149]|uniref:hypothetical protein n=1 Tax=Bradyrhizobium sp. 149 TaxID=2782624 RepID=UPI001FF81C06|nr:hypothetical protein [Bradyrhizobium sp. 149]MCK1654034.1 hypothetical protein [Bradyrhizobium sp. 149]